MKLNKIRFFFVALIFTICGVTFRLDKGVVSYADEYVGFNKTPEEFDDDTVFKDEYDTFLEAYYTNLTSNIGNNIKGSCGYVALGMLLSYYDTYLNDIIIPDQYDVVLGSADKNMNKSCNSPGISDEYVNSFWLSQEFDVSSVDYLNSEQYYGLMLKLATRETEPSLHAKLLTIGHDLGYYGNLSDSLPGGTMPYMVTNVLKKYLTEIGFAENTDYTITTKSSTDSDIRKFVIENINKKGLNKDRKPVLIGVINGFDFVNAHFCVAYDYDEKNDEIYANFGYQGENQHTRVSNAYSTYFFALTIDFKMEHTHTNNYSMKVNGEDVYYCWDSDEIITYHKNHKYNNHYENNGLSHTAYCACGASIFDMHTYTYDYKPINEYKHNAYCVCGAYTNESHSWVAYSALLSLGYDGQLLTFLENDISPYAIGSGSYARCKYCWYIKDTGKGKPTPVLPDI